MLFWQTQGDATQGIAFVSLDKGASAIEAMNLAGYDVMACGNHEFDYGQETAKKNAAPLISRLYRRTP